MTLAQKIEVSYNNSQNQKVEEKYEYIIDSVSKTKDKLPFKYDVSDLNQKYIQILKNKLENDGFVTQLDNVYKTDIFGSYQRNHNGDCIIKSSTLFLTFKENDQPIKGKLFYIFVFSMLILSLAALLMTSQIVSMIRSYIGETNE